MNLRVRSGLLTFALLVGSTGCSALDSFLSPDDAGLPGTDAEAVPGPDAGGSPGYPEPASDGAGGDGATASGDAGAGPDAAAPSDAAADSVTASDAGPDVVDAAAGDVCTVQATTSMTLRANLDSSSSPPPSPFDPQSPDATSNVSAAEIFYDSLGGAHRISLYFAMTGEGAWSYHALASGAEMDGWPSGNVEFANGGIFFDPYARLSSVVPSPGQPLIFRGAAPQTVAFDFGSPTSDGAAGLDGLTDYARAFDVTAESQNGRICW